MKSQSFVPHAIWGLVAVGAFAGGHFAGKSTPVGATPKGGEQSVAAGPGGATPWKSAGGKSPEAAGAVSPADQASATIIGQMTGPLSAEAMKSVLSDILKETDPLKRNRLFAELLEKLTPENVQAAVDAIRDTGMDPANFRDIALLTYAWGKMDPEKAMAYAAEMGGRGQSFMSSSVLAGWANTQPQAAIDWFRSQQITGFEKNVMARGLIEGLVQNDINAATKLAMAETDAELKVQFFDSIARQQMRNDGPEATRAWIDSMIASGTVDVNSLAGATEEVAQQLAQSDPKSAANWAMGLPEGDARRNAMEESIRAWGRKDPTATSEFLTTLPASDTKDRAVQDFAGIIAREDPQAAATWAASIADPERRERTMVRTAQEWYQKDAQAATTWAQGAGLSAEAVQSISQPPEREGWGRGGMRGRRP